MSCDLMKNEIYRMELSMLADSDSAIQKERRDALLLHVAECGECKRYFMEISELLSELSDMEELPLPEGFHEKAMEAVRLNAAPRTRPRTRHWKIYTSAAAAFVGAFLLLSAAISGLGMIGGRSASNESAPVPLSVSEERMMAGGMPSATTAPFSIGEEAGNITNGAEGEKKKNDEAAQFDASAARTFSMTGRGAVQSVPADITVKEYNFEIQTEQFDIVYSEIEALAGTTLNSKLSNYGNATAIVVKTVDAKQLAMTADYIRSLGTVLSESVSERQVYVYVADAEARLSAKSEEYERILRLYTLTENISELTQLEYRLSETISKMDSYKSQINYWNNSANNSVINISIVEKPLTTAVVTTETLGERVTDSFTMSVNTSVSVLENIAVWFAGIILPLAIIAIPAVLVLLAVNVSKKRKRKETEQ